MRTAEYDPDDIDRLKRNFPTNYLSDFEYYFFYSLRCSDRSKKDIFSRRKSNRHSSRITSEFHFIKFSTILDNRKEKKKLERSANKFTGLELNFKIGLPYRFSVIYDF